VLFFILRSHKQTRDEDYAKLAHLAIV
jgi:hypothetical protein